MEIFHVVELFTQVITYVMIVAGVPPVLSMLRTGVTKGIPYPFFLVGSVNAVMSLGYGFLVSNSTFIQINAIAITFNAFYIGAFMHSSKSKSRPITELLCCSLFVLSVYLYVTRLVADDRQMDVIGSIMLTVSSVMLATPLLEVKQCIDEKTGAYISMTLLLSGFTCCGAWLTYGFLLKDFFIYGPNFIGLFAYACQTIAILVYGRTPKVTHTKAE